MPRERWLTGSVIAPTSYICRRVFIPNDLNVIMAVNGALLALTKDLNWEQFGLATVEETTSLMTALFYDYVGSNCSMIGSIFAYATSDPPNNCLPCDGSTHDRTDYPDLYQLLDPVFIVDADTFITPDLRGRTVIGAGVPSVPSGLSSHAVGDIGGEEMHTLTETEMPVHAHSYIPPIINVDIEAPGVPDPVAAGLGLPTDTGTSGGGAAHNNMQPFMALKYGIVAR